MDFSYAGRRFAFCPPWLAFNLRSWPAGGPDWQSLVPALLLIPVIFIRFNKELNHRDWFTAGLAISVVLSLVFPLFFQYEVDRSITRMPATALWTCLVLGFPILWMAFPRGKTLPRLGLVVGYVMIILAGLCYSGHSLLHTRHGIFILHRRPGCCVTAMIIGISCPAETQVLDRVPERSVTIFGRIHTRNSASMTHCPNGKHSLPIPIPATDCRMQVTITSIWIECGGINLPQPSKQIFQATLY